MKYYSSPEVIARVRTVQDGDDRDVSDKIVGVQVLFDDSNHREGTAQLDVRKMGKKGEDSFVIEIPLSELMAALTTATLNREEDTSK